MIKVSVSPEQLVQGRATELDIVFTNTARGTCSNIVFKLSLPAQIRLLRGNERIQVSRLSAGESVSRTVRVRGDAVGRWHVDTTNFSFRDPYDISVRVPSVAIDVTVSAAIPTARTPEAEFRLAVDHEALTRDEWAALRGHVENVGQATLRDVAVAVDGPIDVYKQGLQRKLGMLAPAERGDFTFYVRPYNAGQQVPVNLTITHTSDSGARLQRTDTITIHVRDPLTQSSESRDTTCDVILYLAANPRDTMRLRLDQEVRDISEALQRGEFRDRYKLVPSFAVRVRDISQDVIRHKPRIIHFAGHGEIDGGLCAEDDSGNSFLVDKDALVELVGLAKEVEGVIINACNTGRLAEALAEHVDYVVGIRYKIGDKAAVEFSVGFYQAIAANRPIDAAFHAGHAVFRPHCESLREIQSPFLLRRGQRLSATTE